MTVGHLRNPVYEHMNVLTFIPQSRGSQLLSFFVQYTISIIAGPALASPTAWRLQLSLFGCCCCLELAFKASSSKSCDGSLQMSTQRLSVITHESIHRCRSEQTTPSCCGNQIIILPTFRYHHFSSSESKFCGVTYRNITIICCHTVARSLRYVSCVRLCWPLDSLLQLLERNFGISGLALQWLTSFLTDRTQQVTYNGTLSKLQRLLYGVPQGSALGPSLFNLYTTDIGTIVESHRHRVHQ